MREIKFRVWNIDEYISLNKAIHDDIVVIQQPSSSNGSLIEINWEGVELEQFTGMQDKNGTPIYEGDILEDDEHYMSYVFWCDDSHMWACSDVGGLCDMPSDIKVIGNIHQHAHLLEQNKC